MNLRRGFRRITFVLAIVGAIFCGVCAMLLVVDEKNIAQSHLRWKEMEYSKKYPRLVLDEPVIDEPKKEGEHRETGWEQFPIVVIDGPKKEGEHRAGIFDDIWEEIVRDKRIAKEELRELKNSFWVNLSKAELVGLCILASLTGGAAGFYGTWVVIWFHYCPVISRITLTGYKNQCHQFCNQLP